MFFRICEKTLNFLLEKGQKRLFDYQNNHDTFSVSGLIVAAPLLKRFDLLSFKMFSFSLVWRARRRRWLCSRSEVFEETVAVPTAKHRVSIKHHQYVIIKYMWSRKTEHIDSISVSVTQGTLTVCSQSFKPHLVVFLTSVCSVTAEK